MCILAAVLVAVLAGEGCLEGRLAGGAGARIENRVGDIYSAIAPDANMGDWRGKVTRWDGTSDALVAQVIALGGGRYLVVFAERFDDPTAKLFEMKGLVKEGQVTISGKVSQGPYAGTKIDGYIRDGRFLGRFAGERMGSFILQRVVRLSPTLGEKAPAGAVVLLDGDGFEQWTLPEGLVGVVDLVKVTGGGADRAVYLRTHLYSRAEQKVRFLIGSDDAVKVWVNGDMVWANLAFRPINCGDDVVDVQLDEGFNEVRLKVVNGGGNWQACLKVEGVTGGPAPVFEKDIYGGGDGYTDEYLRGNDGFVTVWEVSEVFRSEGKGAQEIFAAVQTPEQGGYEHWQVLDRADMGTNEVRWRLVDGAMEVVPGTGTIVSRSRFGDFKLHLEFRTPFLPGEAGQKRGNSGVYLQGRYEVQILDTYALERQDNYCGGIYKQAIPAVNMCAPPGQWQSFDIEFRSARVGLDGSKVENARLTVRHNGVVIHDEVDLSGPTAGGLGGNEWQDGPLMLQNHGDAVQFRNIWVVPK